MVNECQQTRSEFAQSSPLSTSSEYYLRGASGSYYRHVYPDIIGQGEEAHDGDFGWRRVCSRRPPYKRREIRPDLWFCFLGGR